ncbi:unnamed protein product [Schistosoma mattheei]|uniref:Ribosome production factor 2 homolog n=2 Tax=Schistosoma mattheei TaxID=31246 RepID=A0AA85B8Y5_9TREM|nr:unnamed protein product [Schistosoma mattheei]
MTLEFSSKSQFSSINHVSAKQKNHPSHSSLSQKYWILDLLVTKPSVALHVLPRVRVINKVASSVKQTPDGKVVQITLEDATPSADFDLRRVSLPSEDKWKRAHRVPPEVMKGDKTPKNKSVDVFGSRIGRVHVGKSSELENLRPGSTIRTALTGHRKRGFERIKSGVSKSKKTSVHSDLSVSKRRKLFTDA